MKLAVIGARLDLHARAGRRARAAARRCCRSTTWRCIDVDDAAARRARRLARRMLDRAAHPARLRSTTEPRRGRRGRGRRARADPRRRAGGAHGRRVGAARVRLPRPGDDRLRRAREGAAHRSGRARHRRARVRALAPDAWIVDFTNPVGIVTKALLDAGHRAVGLCSAAMVFQRHFANVLDVDAGADRARPRRAQPPDVGARRPARRRRRAAGAARREHVERVARATGLPAARATARHRAVVLPALLLRPRRRRREQRRRTSRAPQDVAGDRSASCSTSTRTRRSTRSRSC